jgi:hypothetical protein
LPVAIRMTFSVADHVGGVLLALGPRGIRLIVNQSTDQTEQLLMLWMDRASIEEGS